MNNIQKKNTPMVLYNQWTVTEATEDREETDDEYGVQKVSSYA